MRSFPKRACLLLFPEAIARPQFPSAAGSAHLRGGPLGTLVCSVPGPQLRARPPTPQDSSTGPARGRRLALYHQGNNEESITFCLRLWLQDAAHQPLLRERMPFELCCSRKCCCLLCIWDAAEMTVLHAGHFVVNCW